MDEVRRNGLDILTGSQLLEVSQAVTQSLAGRTAVLWLLPFSVAEAMEIGASADIDALQYAGFYPRIYDQGLNPTQALSDYFETYVERDLRQLSELRNLSAFQRFARICAGRVGQLLNAQSLGADVGVSHSTAREWLSLLEASHVVFLLNPFHGNLSKRLIKSGPPVEGPLVTRSPITRLPQTAPIDTETNKCNSQSQLTRNSTTCCCGSGRS